MIPRLKELYFKEIQSSLKEKLGFKNTLMSPKLEKVVINMGLGLDGNEPIGVWAGDGDVMLGIGGGHYAPRHKSIISNTNIWLGHVLANYSLQFDVKTNEKDSSGPWQFAILNAINAPTDPPITKKISKYIKPVEKLPTESIVTPIAIAIPIIPNKFPCLEVSGEESPLKARINNTPDTRYKVAEKLAHIIYLSFFFFLYIASILWVTKNPPKIFIAANEIAKKPKILDILKVLSESPANPAMIAPTIITDEIAFVTDINGVCKEGVTLQTT